MLQSNESGVATNVFDECCVATNAAGECCRATKAGTTLLENRRFYSYFIIGKPGVLLCNRNYEVGITQ